MFFNKSFIKKVEILKYRLCIERAEMGLDLESLDF